MIEFVPPMQYPGAERIELYDRAVIAGNAAQRGGPRLALEVDEYNLPIPDIGGHIIPMPGGQHPDYHTKLRDNKTETQYHFGIRGEPSVGFYFASQEGYVSLNSQEWQEGQARTAYNQIHPVSPGIGFDDITRMAVGIARRDMRYMAGSGQELTGMATIAAYAASRSAFRAKLVNEQAFMEEYGLAVSPQLVGANFQSISESMARTFGDWTVDPSRQYIAVMAATKIISQLIAPRIADIAASMHINIKPARPDNNI